MFAKILERCSVEAWGTDCDCQCLAGCDHLYHMVWLAVVVGRVLCHRTFAHDLQTFYVRVVVRCGVGYVIEYERWSDCPGGCRMMILRNDGCGFVHHVRDRTPNPMKEIVVAAVMARYGDRFSAAGVVVVSFPSLPRAEPLLEPVLYSRVYHPSACLGKASSTSRNHCRLCSSHPSPCRT